MSIRFRFSLGCVAIAAFSGSAAPLAFAAEATEKPMAVAATGTCVKSGNTPCLITAGGTYSGTWTSTDPAAPVVVIATTAPVVIHNCVMTGAGDLVNAWNTLHTNVSIDNCVANVTNPGGVNLFSGSFFIGNQVSSFSAQHNYVYGANFGIQLGGTGTASGNPRGSIVIKYNKFVNFMGLLTDGAGGYIRTDFPPQYGGQNNANHFVILGNMPGIAKPVEISWNYVQNDPGVSSIGDVIDLYSAGGTSTNHVLIHDNYFVGGYPANPIATEYGAAGITMDGKPYDTAATATAFVDIYSNQIVARSANGISMAAGHDTSAYSNRIVSTGFYDGTSPQQPYIGWAAVNVTNNYSQLGSVFFNNTATGNVSANQITWAYASAPGQPVIFQGPPVRVDYQIDGVCNMDGSQAVPTRMTICDNTLLPSPVTTSTEENEASLWARKLAAHAITVGPTSVTGPVTNGVCGSSNGLTNQSSAPTENLCSSGTATPVIGLDYTNGTSSPWFWSCQGANSGATARCVASR